MRSEEKQHFEIPQKLRNKSGKLIYLSMGSMGGADLELMKRLVSILSKSKHRFIVSKGVFHDQYELADNMWGEKTVPQIKVLSVVDLVITHGGNNTFTETLFFGKPMIVMPLFGDQYDNAQRIEEKGFGIRLNPYDFEENVLLESIDKLLNDEKLALKLEKISERIQSSKRISKVAELIESLVV
jgi:UDP:flavonoid glycosyltransferase YjiC (YdhE family)